MAFVTPSAWFETAAPCRGVLQQPLSQATSTATTSRRSRRPSIIASAPASATCPAAPAELRKERPSGMRRVAGARAPPPPSVAAGDLAKKQPPPPARPPPRTNQLRPPTAGTGQQAHPTPTPRPRPRRTAGIRKASVTNGPKIGGWRCPACGVQLYRQQEECSLCQTPRPVAGAAGDDGGYVKRPGGKRHARADVRSREFTNKMRGMPAGDWRGVVRELEEEERLEEADAQLHQQGGGGGGGGGGGDDEAAMSLGAPSVYGYHAVMQRLEECGRWREASAVLRRMHRKLGPRAGDVPTLSAACLHKAMSACFAAEQWGTCSDLLEEAKGWATEASYRSFKLAIEACVRGGRWERGLSVLMERTSEKTDRKWEALPFNRVMQACVDAGRWQEAVALLDHMKDEVGAEPNLVTYGIAINAYGNAGEWRRALGVLKESLPEMRTSGGASRENACMCFAYAIRACKHAGEFDEALSVLDRDLPATGVAPNVLVLHEALTACGVGGRWQQALELLPRALAVAGGKPSSCLRSYTTAIKACGRAGQWEDALALFRRGQQDGLQPDEVCYAEVMSACAGGGRADETLGLLREMSAAAGLRPTVPCYNAAIVACGAGGDWRRSVELLEEMPTVGLAPGVSTCNMAINALRRGGQCQRVLDLLERMSTAPGLPAPDATSYNTAITACESAGRFEEAVGLFRAMERIGVAPDVVGYTATIQALGRCGRWEEALALLGEVRSRANPAEPNVRTYVAAVHAAGYAGQWERAVSVFRLMLADGLVPTDRAWSAVISACEAAAGVPGRGDDERVRAVMALLVRSREEAGVERPDDGGGHTPDSEQKE
ncbi:unnamed protein product [Ectocarpus sp. 4 AP-2014]